ncbi:hypothetical protein GCM10028807_05440 [Spirosoma daeguense]
MTYFKDIQSGIRTTLKGLSLTLKHLRNATKQRTNEGISSETYFDQQNGLVTLQYPHEQLPIPDNGRYRLRNEIDDCIVCDKCAKVCPVDCITIDAIKATEEVGRASDGSPIRLYAGKFDIDMAKCCYCGLCTVVCPTECLTMDKKFDYSEFELGKLTYNFTNLTPDQADEKRALYDQFLREKEEAKRNAVTAKTPPKATTIEGDTLAKPAGPPRPVFRPTAKPMATPPAEKSPENSEGSSIEHPSTDATPTEMERIAQGGIESTRRPVFRPTQKPKTSVTDIPTEESKAEQTSSEQATVDPEAESPKPKPAPFRPSMKPGASAVSKSTLPENQSKPEPDSQAEPTPESPKPIAKPAGFRPTMKPASTPAENSDATPANTPTPKPAFRPTMKPPKAVLESTEESPTDVPVETETPKPKPTGFRPTMKPAKPVSEEATTTSEQSASEPAMQAETPKPAFRPTMKPASVPSKPQKDVTDVRSTPNATLQSNISAEPEKPIAKPAFRPTMKPTKPASEEIAKVLEQSAQEPTLPAEPPKPKPAFRPTMKPSSVSVKPSEDIKNEVGLDNASSLSETPEVEQPKPKPAFRPTMKPKPKTDNET